MFTQMLKYINVISHLAFRNRTRQALFQNRKYFRNLQRHFFIRMASSSTSKHTNRLAQEKSPYLLQHATNPVDWYAWGEDAFLKAKAENKPIFLSVGYSTCHWCHVMERESFENEEIGRLMSDKFVCIKVDREERPDVDKVYMTFVQATNGHGGWPMSVWLTPDLKPIVGGTYFPPDDRYYGKPGFKTLLTHISSKWEENSVKCMEQGTMLLDALLQGTAIKTQVGETIPGPDCIEKCYQQMEKGYDKEKGGFGKAPKFPQPVNFNFLYRLYNKENGSSRGHNSLEMCLHTLRMMAKGGMHDHVAQGFHRYSTDGDWHVPHFEKMLYDQAQLAVSYLEAYQITKEEFYADVARDIFKYVNRDLSHKAGGFYSAEDADSYPQHDSTTKKEGAFCVWTYSEIESLLSQELPNHVGVTESHVFCHHFDVKQEGNVDPLKDPHDELKKQNVLIERGSIEQTADEYQLSLEETKQLLDRCKEKLFEVRLQRPRAHLDDKMLTAWNALMISGFACGGKVLNDDKLIQRAVQAATFIKDHLYDEQTGTLHRSCYAEKDAVKQLSTPISGFSDDYAFLIQALMDLYEATFDEQWLSWSERLQDKQDQLFWDSENSGYYTSQEGDKSIVMRMKDEQDGAEPSANSVSALNLLRLSNYVNRPELRTAAEKIMIALSEHIQKIPIAVPGLMCAFVWFHSTPIQIIINGDKEADDTKQLLRCIHSHFLPNKILILADGKSDHFLRSRLQVLSGMQRKDKKATVYVCENFTCSLPVDSVVDLEKILNEKV